MSNCGHVSSYLTVFGGAEQPPGPLHIPQLSTTLVELHWLSHPLVFKFLVWKWLRRTNSSTYSTRVHNFRWSTLHVWTIYTHLCTFKSHPVGPGPAQTPHTSGGNATGQNSENSMKSHWYEILSQSWEVWVTVILWVARTYGMTILVNCPLVIASVLTRIVAELGDENSPIHLRTQFH